jgi:hypothetical protein
MDWARVCVKVASRPRVVHRLPGRLRIHIPLLRRLQREHQGLADAVGALLTAPDGIEQVTVSLDSGNALLLFDQQQLTEGEVLDYLRGVLEIFLRHRERFAQVPTERLPAVVSRLEPVLRDAVRRKLSLRTDIEIGDDVLA